ncbi:MAG TPA: hypothetical protein VKY92_00340 [Verrucomicrobiae bacterium]|jgi:hypothetical protein|nr:hypothetical protein [Verrucomicrobiae bacterium]
MAWFKAKPDPLSDRARALTEEIDALEAQIKSLDNRLQQQHSQPRLRSTAIPQGATVPRTVNGPSAAAPEPIFEAVDVDRLQGDAENHHGEGHFNDLGVRKYDLPALFRRLRNHFRGPAATNPKLVSYLAAGGIQGLRPLRYEKRVARNRFIFFFIVLFLMLLGLAAVFFRR